MAAVDLQDPGRRWIDAWSRHDVPKAPRTMTVRLRNRRYPVRPEREVSLWNHAGDGPAKARRADPTEALNRPVFADYGGRRDRRKAAGRPLGGAAPARS